MFTRRKWCLSAISRPWRSRRYLLNAYVVVSAFLWIQNTYVAARSLSWVAIVSTQASASLVSETTRKEQSHVDLGADVARAQLAGPAVGWTGTNRDDVERWSDLVRSTCLKLLLSRMIVGYEGSDARAWDESTQRELQAWLNRVKEWDTHVGAHSHDSSACMDLATFLKRLGQRQDHDPVTRRLVHLSRALPWNLLGLPVEKWHSNHRRLLAPMPPPLPPKQGPPLKSSAPSITLDQIAGAVNVQTGPTGANVSVMKPGSPPFGIKISDLFPPDTTG